MTPTELVQQWTPWLRGLAFKTGVSFDDVRQEAWLLAATMPAGDGADDVGRRRKWQAAVRTQVKKQKNTKIIYADPAKPTPAGFQGTGWLTEATAGTVGDRHGFLEALEKIAGMYTEQQLADALGMAPETTAEIAKALGVCERQARRIKNKINELKAVQGDLFADLFSDDESEVPV